MTQQPAPDNLGPSNTHLLQAEGLYQAMVELAPQGLVLHQQGKIIHANPAALRLWGAASAAELRYTPIANRIHPQHQAAEMQRVQDVLSQGASVPLRQSMHLRLDGRSIDVENQSMPIVYGAAPAVLLSFQDISARKLIETSLRESEDRFRALTQLSSDWYWEQDEQYRFVVISGTVTPGTGLRTSDVIGKTHRELPTLNVTSAQWDRHTAQLDKRQTYRDLELRWPDTNGAPHWSAISGAPLFNAAGAFKGYRGVGRDITPQKLASVQVHRLAFYDALTGLPNRRLLQEQLKKALQLNTRHRLRGALLFIDLDNFKTLNDTLGHDVGDILLQQVAQRLVANVRGADTVARLGGDEFVVMLEHLDRGALEAASQAEVIGQKILSALNVPYQLAGHEHCSSPSIGMTMMDESAQSVDDLIKQADLAMYQAKSAGRNTLRFFDVAMQSEVDTRAALESDLRDGLQGGEELELHFQPVVDSDGRVSGAEALVRWQQPVRGLLLPCAFMGLAETTGLILPLGRWVLTMACEQLARWASNPQTAELILSFNVSVRQLREPEFVAQVTKALLLAGARPNRLRLELTEKVLVRRLDEVIEKMNALRELGVSFSIDDFGTGHASLIHLKQLPLSQLKIDHSFVHNVLNDANDAAIARTIVGLGNSLGLGVVAEGVETEAQKAFLSQMGCRAYQGFLFANAMPIDEFNEWVAKATAR
jgi:diguanylate cyclase (GGDEF)-like protein/PAS domain S-box-containing protein